MKDGRMNAERLFALYERVADAPDAVARLRRLVLDLAVRGKLVEQDPNDEPASELLKRIARTKNEETAPRRTTKERLLADVKAPPFCLPPTWHWARLGEVAELVRGISFPASAKSNMPGDGRIPCLRSGNIQTDIVWEDFIYVSEDVLKSRRQLVRTGDVLISIANSYALVGKCSIVDAVPYSATFGAFLAAIRLYLVLPAYAKTFLTSDSSTKAFRVGSSQTTNIANITFSTIRDHPIALPPLAEQHRIVAKVGELMALLDRLETARTEREATRDRLTTASLARLTASDTTSETFPAHACFAIDALPALTTRPDQIKALRQTIRNLAVRGKLVEQDSDEEPASVLLKRIESEKARLVKVGALKPERRSKEADLKVERFELPSGWAWTSLQSVCLSISDGDHQPPPKSEAGVPFLVIGDVRTKKINYASERRVQQDYFDRIDPIRRPQLGDLLYTLVGSFGIPIPVRSNQPFCVQRHIAILRPAKQVNPFALAICLESEFVFAQSETAATGIAQKTVPLAALRSLTLPLPPLAEQLRIVAKLDALMALCDRLEATLITADATEQHLLEALIHEALSGSSSSREAA